MRHEIKLLAELYGHTHRPHPRDRDTYNRDIEYKHALKGRTQRTRITPFLHHQHPQQSLQEEGKGDCHVQHYKEGEREINIALTFAFWGGGGGGKDVGGVAMVVKQFKIRKDGLKKLCYTY